MKEASCCLSDNTQAGVIEALNPISRYLDDLTNVDNLNFDQMVKKKINMIRKCHNHILQTNPRLHEEEQPQYIRTTSKVKEPALSSPSEDCKTGRH